MTKAQVPQGVLDLDWEAQLRKRREQREQWDTLASAMPDLLPASSTAYYRRCEIALIQRSFGSLKGKRVLKLDLWNEAVNTRILNWMKSEGAQAFGIDISYVTTSRALGNSVLNGGPLHLSQADIRNLPFEDDSFDLVYTMGTIEHIDEYHEALCEVHRTLRVGGKAIVGVPHKWNIFLRPLMVSVLDFFDKYPYSPEKSFSSKELRQVVERAGFKVCRRAGILTVPGIIRMADLFFFRRNIPAYKLTPLLLWPFDYLETHWEWPGLFGYLLALVVEKES